jgi:hypothetical protein
MSLLAERTVSKRFQWQSVKESMLNGIHNLSILYKQGPPNDRSPFSIWKAIYQSWEGCTYCTDLVCTALDISLAI